MIPYDELVIALAEWRGRQGLPISGLSGALTPPPAVPNRPPPQAQPATRATPRPMAAQPAPAATPAPAAAPPQPRRRTAPFGASAPRTPPPLAPPDDSIDHDLETLDHGDDEPQLELHEHDHGHDIDQEVSEVLSEHSAYPEDATFELGLAGPGIGHDPEPTSVAPTPRPGDRYAATDPGRRPGQFDLDATDDEALDRLDDPDHKN
jgi:hypothetical protein